MRKVNTRENSEEIPKEIFVYFYAKSCVNVNDSKFEIMEFHD